MVSERHRWPALFSVVLASAMVPTALASSDAEVPEAVEGCLSCHAIQPGEPELEARPTEVDSGRP